MPSQPGEEGEEGEEAMSTDMKTLRRRHFAEAADVAQRLETSARALQLTPAQREGWEMACAWVADMLRQRSELDDLAEKVRGL